MLGGGSPVEGGVGTPALLEGVAEGVIKIRILPLAPLTALHAAGSHGPPHSPQRRHPPPASSQNLPSALDGRVPGPCSSPTAPPRVYGVVKERSSSPPRCSVSGPGRTAALPQLAWAHLKAVEVTSPPRKSRGWSSGKRVSPCLRLPVHF